MSLPIRARMTLWYVALLALIVAALGAFLVLRLRADLLAATDKRLSSAADQIAKGYRAEGPPEARDVSATVLAGKAAASQVLTPAGHVVASFGADAGRAPMLAVTDRQRVLAGARIDRTVTLGTSDHRFRVVARSATRGAARFLVVAGESTSSIDRSSRRLTVLLLLALPAVLAATAGGGWWLATRALRPIGRLTTEADQISVERLAERLPVPATGDEVARLAETLNTMLARIERSVEEQQRLVADASHELRTPLAAMRAELEVSLRGDDLGPHGQSVLRSTLEEVERLSATVEGLLVLARADRGSLNLDVAPVDLAEIAGEAAQRRAAVADSRNVTLELDLAPALTRGDADSLGHAVGNILDNAIRFSRPGGIVRVATAGDARERWVQVLDEGAGIPPAERERIFDRFYRLDTSRTRSGGGAGIGLSIVREIAGAHGGRVWVESGEHGGSAFTLAVPAALEPAGAAEPESVAAEQMA
jgi:heavy metal sensor kinase